MERRLAAIMALDVVGYSRLMEQDETGTLDKLRKLNGEILNPIFEQHGGRIFKLTGDGVFVEFGSAVDAVNSACEIQRLMQLPAAPLGLDQLQLRIGINLGDVVIEGTDVYGDGVNVAARLEGIAEAGTIYVSGNVYEFSNKILPFRFVFVGSKHLKNISTPVRVFRVVADPEGPKSLGRRIYNRRRAAGLMALAALSAVAAGTYVALRPTQNSFPPIASNMMAFPLPPKPSITILPLNAASTNPTEVLIARGLSSGVRQRLSKRGELFIIAEHSSFQLDGTLGAGEAARRLGVRYVLSGGYEGQDGYALVHARLSDALAGHEIWHQSFKVDSNKLVQASDEIATSILTALNFHSSDSSLDGIDSASSPTASLEGWLLHLRAEEKWLRSTRDQNGEARQLWQQAYSRDPNFMLALLMIGWTEWADARFAWRDDWFGALDRAEKDAQRVLVRQTLEGSARDLLGSIYLQRMDHLRALEFARLAVAADPNDADAWGRVAVIEAFAGKPRDAIEAAQTAMRLNPYYPAWYLMPEAEAYRLDGNYAKAIETVLQEIRRSDNPYARLRLAIYFTQAGDREHALEQVKLARKAWPTLTISDWGWLSRFKDQQQTERDRTILSQLGVPEFMSFECMTHNQCP